MHDMIDKNTVLLSDKQYTDRGIRSLDLSPGRDYTTDQVHEEFEVNSGKK